MRFIHSNWLATGLICLATVAMADDPKTSVKVDGVSTKNGDTSILIKKGDVSGGQCTEYQIVDGNEEISGDPAPVKNGAHKNWKAACADWKSQTKELNSSAKNSLLALSCGSASASQDGENWVYRSQGTYKIKVKIKEK